MIQNNQSKKYKDTVFVDLFSEDKTAKHNFISLYNALFDENLTEKEYLERKNMEVENMLIAEYDYEMDIAVQREEAAREAEKKAEKKAERKAKETVKELKNMGVDINKLSKATGLTIEEIKAL